jgi:serine/threonine-protein kinase SRK2
MTAVMEPHGPLLANMDLSRYGYQVRTIVGRGRFGLVVAAASLANPASSYAIKLIPRGSIIEEASIYMQREITNHASLKHPFIIELKEVFLSPAYLCLVMELATATLLTYARSQPGCLLTEDMARHFMRQLLVGLDYMHRLGVANRDLKLENVLVTYQDSCMVAKLSDFGYSKHTKHSTARSSVGTAGYTAPEVIIGGIAYDAPATDIWSLGVMLYVMITGKFPFDLHSRSWSQDIMQGAFAPFDERLNLSPGVKNLLERMLEPCPRKRASMAEIMQHEWVVDGLSGGYRLEDGSRYGVRVELGPGIECRIEELVRRAVQLNDSDNGDQHGDDEDVRCVFTG